MAKHQFLSRMSFSGHPIHPMLIHLPLASLIMVVGSDVAYIMTGDPFWARASLWLLGVGAFGGWGAALAGLVDLVTVPGVRRLITGWCHSIIAVMLLSFATFNWLIRVADPEQYLLPWGIYLSCLGAVLTAVAGILGGQLVYDHGIAVDKV